MDRQPDRSADERGRLNGEYRLKTAAARLFQDSESGHGAKSLPSARFLG